MKRGIPFVLTLFAGIACLAVFGSGNRSFQTAVVATVCVMGAYLAWILWSQRAARTYDRYADSFYYLGFMLTLFALLVALLGGATREGMDLAGVLNKFGLGLVTTLVGLAGRIALLEFAGGVEETTDDALVQVRHSAERLAVELSLAGRSIQQANIDMSNAVSKQQETIAQTIDQNVRSIVSGFNVLHQSLLDTKQAIGDAATQLQTHVSSTLVTSLDEVAGKVKNITENVVQTTESATKAIASSLARLDRALDDVTVNAKGVAKTTAETTETASKAIAESLARLNQEISKLNVPPDLLRETFAKALNAASAEFMALTSQIQSVTKQASMLAMELQAIREGASRVNETVLDIGKVGDAVAQVGERARALSPIIGAMQTSLAQLSTTSSESAREIDKGATELHAQLVEQLDGIKRIRAQLEQEVQQSADAVRRVHESLVDNARFITEKLGV